jgi:hypothetical protein
VKGNQWGGPPGPPGEPLLALEPLRRPPNEAHIKAFASGSNEGFSHEKVTLKALT